MSDIAIALTLLLIVLLVLGITITYLIDAVCDLIVDKIKEREQTDE